MHAILKILLKLLDRSQREGEAEGGRERELLPAFRNVFCDVPLSSRPQQICFVNGNFGGCNDDAATSYVARLSETLVQHSAGNPELILFRELLFAGCVSVSGVAALYESAP